MQPSSPSEPESLRTHYERFAELEAAGASETYAAWARGVAADEEILDLVLTLPWPKRQANLLFAAARHLGAGATEFPILRTWLLDHWEPVVDVMLSHSTQTNEAGRCAVLLPVLSELEQPLSLIEVGASAGLCLFPDRYSYDFDTANGRVEVHPASGPSSVSIRCTMENHDPPDRVPDVAWRAGIDLNPLDVTDPEQRRWLQSLIWPEHRERRKRLEAAAAIAASDPPRILAGDLLGTVDALIDEAPSGTRTVVFHSAVLAYLGAAERRRFAELMLGRADVTWISNEGRAVLPEIGRGLPGMPDGRFVLAVDGRPVALTGPHGQSFQGLGDVPPPGPHR
ncbi:uncharacterized protein DUF2332 [Brevibacterium sanguinis]|uniref:Uncharacterized protein DUF2332 n=2 Tax=Brevibacterium TaxID=1696 RepID=A0A366INH8_9MICO|nr:MULTISPECIES: DUF2332 domain-containing protein [Brevibacterium]RBP67200.1 uncharacterized protein DUF2332 [Brevibacterium sanguinis]RBP73725.1 uncharacterized protein DUF2332 [Brevibacterium celere]